ncbi:Probable protein phosphatase 2C 13 [Striga hermonthica]|uniref:protein-serine/threonine phosphatase n=1 Tax=Striga hermonthica TaxID=68872 RepID=A0A9N7RIQ8_STRHE|nr:Probable protein phosphatase 2C 13 [Striga hermonthica]
MVAEAEIVCRPAVAVQYLCVPSPPSPKTDAKFFDTSPAAASAPISIDLSRIDSALSCSTSTQTPIRKVAPKICSGSHTDIGPRSSNEDQHIRIDDLPAHLGSSLLGWPWPWPASFYAVFDGHGGPDAALYMKNNATRFFFEEAQLPQAPSTDDIDEKKQFLQDLETSHRGSFLAADQALSNETGPVDPYCGTTALTALILGRNLLIANVGDCRAVLCRNGNAVQLSRDHRPSCQVERRRVEDLGGKIEYGYLNGDLAVTRALGDWYMKLPLGSASPLTAEPEFGLTLLTEDDEFLIIGCDGIWDVMSNQEAVCVVREELGRCRDPNVCAQELVNQALMRDSCDNVTAVVVCFSSSNSSWDSTTCSRRSRFRFCMSEEARSKLRSLLECNNNQ